MGIKDSIKPKKRTMIRAIFLLSCMLAAFANTKMTDGSYNISKKFDFGFTYDFSVSFESMMTIPFNSGEVDVGAMHLCVQTFGSQAVGPYNCSLNYMYDNANDKFHWKSGDCDQQVSHQHTDMMVKSVAYDKSKDEFTFNFDSHGPTGGDYVLTKSDKPVISCPAATNDLPFQYCPKSALLEQFMSIIA